MRQARFRIQIIKSSAIHSVEPEIRWSDISLYSQPDFLDAVAPGKGYYARIGIEGEALGSVFFPFTGRKLGWKWILFQPSFCQRFQPFGFESLVVGEEYWQAWFNFLRDNTWRGHWPYEVTTGHQLFTSPLSTLIGPKTNYIFPLLDDLDEMLAKWKPGRRNTLKKSTNLVIEQLDQSEFTNEVNRFSKDREKYWRPTEKEITILIRIYERYMPYVNACRISLKSESIALVLLLDWGGRLHYLFSLSNSEGLKQEAIPFFFKELISSKKGSGKIIDFEGSSLPGVAAFFKSMGAVEEPYGLWTK